MAHSTHSKPDVNEMTDQEYKVYENRVRRMAERQGLQLQKSRRRDPRAYDYGTYQLVDVQANGIVAHAGASGYGLSLDEVEDYLTVDEREADAR